MKYKIKERKIYTYSGNVVKNLTRRGFRLRSVAYFVNGNGVQSYILTKNGL